MARITPLRAKKHPSEMEKYAKSRNSVVPSTAAMITTLREPQFDPESDLHYLTRASEIKANPKRHRAAKHVARVRIKRLSEIA